MPVVDKYDLDQHCLEIKKRNANKLEPKALKADMYKTIARELTKAKCVAYINISIDIDRYAQRNNISLEAILIIAYYLIILRVLMIIINSHQCHAKQHSGVTSRCRRNSSNVSGANSCLQQTKLSPASEISPRGTDSFSDSNGLFDSSCTETETRGHKNEEGISSETNTEHYSRITNNTNQLLQDCINTIFAVTIKTYNDLPEVANLEDVLSQEMTDYSELKTDESQDDLQVQTVVGLTGRYRSGSRDYGTGSASSGCRKFRARNTSPSSRSVSPISRNGLPSSRTGLPRSRSGSQSSSSRIAISRSGSPSSRSGSPSSRSGSPSLRNDVSEHSHDISCSRKAQLFARTDEGTKETTSLLDSGTPLAGTAEYDTGYAGDIALGQNCVGEEDLKAGLKCKLLPSYIQGIYDNGSCLYYLRNLKKTLNDGLVFGKSVNDELSGKVVSHELSGETTFDELSRKTVGDELSVETALDELYRKTVSDELLGETALDELYRKTVSDELSVETALDELYRKTVSDELSGETAFDELLWETAVDELSWRPVIDFQDFHSNLTEKCSFVLPDVCSQPKVKHQCMPSYERNILEKLLVAADMNTDSDKDNESSETDDVECFLEYVDYCKEGNDEDAAEEAMKNIDIHYNLKSSFKGGEFCKLRTENMPYRLKVNNEKPEGIREQLPRLSLSENWPVNAYIYRKFFAESQDLSGTEATNDVPRKSNRFQAETDNQFEENGAECTETEFSKIVSKAVGNRAAGDKSRMCCNCPHPQRCCYKGKYMHSHNEVSTFGHQRCCHKDKDMHSHKEVSTFGTVEKNDLAVSRSGTVEMGDQDLEHCLELLVKFDPARHMPWRHDIQIFHLELPAATSSLYIFMNFEVFRLSSFIFNKFPKDRSMFVTRVAKSGFYFMSLIEQIICFGCGNKFEESQDSSLSSTDSFHRPQCTRHASNKPLDLWVQGLNLDAVTNYFIENESLTPYLLETSSAVTASPESGASNNVLKAGPVSDLNNFTNDYSSGYESDALTGAESDGEANGGDHLSVNSSNGRHPFEHFSINESCSLPANLNHISSVVDEETFDSDRSHLVLTSATRQPVWSGSTPSAPSEDSSEAAPEGAVGDILSLNLGSAAYPHFSIQAVRRESFTVWSPQHSHRPEDLAAAGFFYAGDVIIYTDGSVLWGVRGQGWWTVFGAGIYDTTTSILRMEVEAVTAEFRWLEDKQHTHAVIVTDSQGYMDCVRCFYCGLGLKFWRPGDIPAYQHAKYRPHCRFNILYKGQDYIDNVQQELRSEQGGVGNSVQNQTAPAQPQESLQTTTVPVVGGPQEQDYLNSDAAKDAVRNGWTTDQVRQAVSHIVSEYGESCLEIGLLTDILTHFSTNDEPSLNQPSCSSSGSSDPGINSTMPELTTPHASSAALANALTIPVGHNEQDRHEDNQRMQDAATPAGASNAEQPEARVPNPGDILRSVEREHRLLEERVTCRLCRLNPVSCIYLPCGHVIACHDCADNATHCVFCKKTIIGTANVFLA